MNQRDHQPAQKHQPVSSTREAGSGEVSVGEVGTVLELAESAAEHAYQVVGVGEGGVAQSRATDQGPDTFHRIHIR
ncbi:hypothetical protein FHS40_009009 [Streptomyces spectabilis]|uniref:Uncharacterized protein n=1 Tax=Streptomyces spectabilis TaxID=68270 RepID=A0A7W8B3V6_STRST|nr:hypothetical protein [Streptomyces spectabilis]MBB5109879.1 hypothetical protein [Streptomyces spectabilis]